MVNEVVSQLVRRDCPLPTGTHVIAYCRVSAENSQNGSMTQQEQAITEYSNHHGLILERIYTDEAQSSSSSEKRPALNAMLTDISQRFPQIRNLSERNSQKEEHPFGVVVWKTNRLGRDRQDTTYIKADLGLRGITFIDLNSTGDINSTIDEMIKLF